MSRRGVFVRSVFTFTLCLATACLAVVSPAVVADAAEYVIHISIDGLNPVWLQQVIDAGDAPTLERLQKEGAWTANARTDFTHTVTLPNHTSMITGRPVLQPDGHASRASSTAGRSTMCPKLGATLHNTGNPAAKYIASTFDVVHDAGLSTAFYNTKDKFILYEKSYDERNGAANPHGRKKIDVYFFQDDGPPAYSAEMNRRFLSDLAANHFNYSFVHYRDTDSAGHAFGWGSPDYLRAIATVDGYLADVLKLVESDSKLKGKTAIVVNTDHGGVGANHGESELAVNYTIPVFVWGAGVGHGDLYEMNRDTRTEPGESRLEYSATDQPIRNGDTGNLALDLLGLGPIPGSTINAQQDLRVTSAADFNRDGHVDTADYTLWSDTNGSTTDLRGCQC